jgi:putative transposase
LRITFKYRLYPTRKQKQMIDFTLERCRLLYNRLLAERIHAYKTGGTSLSYVDQANTYSERKRCIPSLNHVYSQVLQDAAKRLDKAFLSFFRRVQRGEKSGFPRFKSKQRYRSFTYPQSGFRLSGSRLFLSKIGDIKIKLHRPLRGKVKTCTISVKNGKYYACFSCEVEPNLLPASSECVGIDLGLASLAVTSDGTFIEAPKILQRNEQKIKRKQQLISRMVPGSNRRRKAIRQLAHLHEKLANQRRDHAHKTSRELVNRYGFIAFEDLDVHKMIKNHRFAKSIADAGWDQLVRFIAYKAESAGRVIVRVNPRNTSQDCSNCNQPVKKSLAVRIHRCPYCGYEADRDVNAAQNILKRALAAAL